MKISLHDFDHKIYIISYSGKLLINKRQPFIPVGSIEKHSWYTWREGKKKKSKVKSRKHFSYLLVMIRATAAEIAWKPNG